MTNAQVALRAAASLHATWPGSSTRDVLTMAEIFTAWLDEKEAAR